MFKALGLLKNKLGVVGARLKYGLESLYAPMYSVTMAASTVLKPLSSYFVTFDGSGNAALTGAADTFISGAIVGATGTGTGGSYTTSSTAGGESMGCSSSSEALYRIPVSSGTYSRANRGKLCDLVVTSSVQGAAVQTATRGHLRLVDGDETSSNKWVVAHINNAKLSGGNAS